MNNEKRLYRVPVTWEMSGYHDVEAWSEDSAVEMAENMGLPDNGEYSCDSLNVDDYVEDITPVKTTQTEQSSAESTDKYAKL
jgi:hypothetical protein